ncbi:hypothetical protein LSH36_260g05075 [Paralvinella palmiformis]|uniref:Uncharacterized protein n=1 Tax=Paralvinella palmiformis TaxID=53620 RepID=A0AAD9JK52_9ANNE|nr:hypothetical protein LSH36_260g05075 [Paralvinella palmiformis]
MAVLGQLCHHHSSRFRHLVQTEETKQGQLFYPFSYFIVSFDSPSEVLPAMRDHCRRDSDVIRPRILRREMELGRPCDHEQCEFGEMNEDLRKRLQINLNKYVKKL